MSGVTEIYITNSFFLISPSFFILVSSGVALVLHRNRMARRTGSKLLV